MYGVLSRTLLNTTTDRGLFLDQHVHIYLSGNTTVISQLKRLSVVNSHWLYPSLMTYMLNNCTILQKKESTNLHPACTQSRP